MSRLFVHCATLTAAFALTAVGANSSPLSDKLEAISGGQYEVKYLDILQDTEYYMLASLLYNRAQETCTFRPDMAVEAIMAATLSLGITAMLARYTIDGEIEPASGILNVHARQTALNAKILAIRINADQVVESYLKQHRCDTPEVQHGYRNAVSVLSHSPPEHPAASLTSSLDEEVVSLDGIKLNCYYDHPHNPYLTVHQSYYTASGALSREVIFPSKSGVKLKDPPMFRSKCPLTVDTERPLFEGPPKRRALPPAPDLNNANAVAGWVADFFISDYIRPSRRDLTEEEIAELRAEVFDFEAITISQDDVNAAYSNISDDYIRRGNEPQTICGVAEEDLRREAFKERHRRDVRLDVFDLPSHDAGYKLIIKNQPPYIGMIASGREMILRQLGLWWVHDGALCTRG